MQADDYLTKLQKQRWDAIIVGGGAAGLWAAGTAAQRGKKVLVLGILEVNVLA